MIKFMLDTNIVSYTIRNKPAEIREAFTAHHGQMCISSVTLMELIFGAERHPQTETLMSTIESMVSRLEVRHFDDAAAVHTGEIRAELAAQGKRIGPYDAMIAGHARASGLIVITNNTKEFSRVSGLRVDDWVAQ